MSDYSPTWMHEHTHAHTHTPSALRLLSSAGADTHQPGPSGGFWRVSWKPLSSPPSTLAGVCVCAPPPHNLQVVSIKCLSLPADVRVRGEASRVGGIRRCVTGLQVKTLSCRRCKTHILLRLAAGMKSRSRVELGWRRRRDEGTQRRRDALTRGPGNNNCVSASVRNVVVIFLVGSESLPGGTYYTANPPGSHN